MAKYEWFFIESLFSGLVLDIEKSEKGGRIITYQKHGGDNQLWTWKENVLMSKTGLVLDVESSNTEQGAQTIAWDYHGGINQQWEIDGNHIISCLNGMVLDIKSGSKDELVGIILWPNKCGDSDNQSWTLLHSE